LTGVWRIILLYFVKTEKKNEDQLADAVFRAQKKPPAPEQGGEKSQVRTGGSASVKGHHISAQHLPAGDGGGVP